MSADLVSRRCDAVILGASLGGLCAGALLANKGYSVIVVDPLREPGSRGGAVERDGYWIGWGRRDGHGIGDVLGVWGEAAETAAREAGVKLNLTKVTGDFIVHVISEGTSVVWPAVGDPDLPPSAFAEATARLAGVRPEDIPRVVDGYLATLQRWAAVEDDEAWSLIPDTVGEWLTRHGVDEPTRRTLLQMFEMPPIHPAADASLGRFILHLHHGAASPVVWASDDTVGGQQALLAPFARRIEELGGEFLFDHKPLEITVDTSRDPYEARGVVVRDYAGLVSAIEAPIVITDDFGWRLPELVDESLLPRRFLEQARDTQEWSADLTCWWAGFRCPPIRRSDGSREDFAGFWHRFLDGQGRLKQYAGGMFWPSALGGHCAPEGKHLLCVFHLGGFKGNRRWLRWSDARQAVDRLVQFLRDHYYADLDECIEWSRYQYHEPPNMLTWYGKPVYRHPVDVATIAGLYCASASAESEVGSYVDIEAVNAHTAVKLALSDRGHLLGVRRT